MESGCGDDVTEFPYGGAELQFRVEWDGEVPVADLPAEGACCAVAGDECGQGRVGAFDHAEVAEVGQLPCSAGDVLDECVQSGGQFVLGSAGQEVGELGGFA
jgi:hypothetical protein